MVTVVSGFIEQVGSMTQEGRGGGGVRMRLPKKAGGGGVRMRLPRKW